MVAQDITAALRPNYLAFLFAKTKTFIFGLVDQDQDGDFDSWPCGTKTGNKTFNSKHFLGMGPIINKSHAFSARTKTQEQK